MKIETVKYAKYNNSSFKDTLYNVSFDETDGTAIIEYADVEYPNGYKNRKQNEVIMSAKNGLIMNFTGSGRFESAQYDDSAKAILDKAKGFKGETFKIKEFLKSEYSIAFDYESKTWIKK